MKTITLKAAMDPFEVKKLISKRSIPAFQVQWGIFYFFAKKTMLFHSYGFFNVTKGQLYLLFAVLQNLLRKS